MPKDVFCNTIVVRVPSDLNEKLVQMAENSHQTLSFFVRQSLENFISRAENDSEFERKKAESERRSQIKERINQLVSDCHYYISLMREMRTEGQNVTSEMAETATLLEPSLNEIIVLMKEYFNQKY